MRGVYSETFIHHFNIPLAHSFTRLYMIFPPHIYILHYATSPWSHYTQFSFLGFSQLNLSEPELIFKYHGQWKEGVKSFCTYTISRYEYNLLKFNDLLSDCDLHDTWGLFHPGGKEYTWRNRNPFVARRLDYTLTNSSFF